MEINSSGLFEGVNVISVYNDNSSAGIDDFLRHNELSRDLVRIKKSVLLEDIELGIKKLREEGYKINLLDSESIV